MNAAHVSFATTGFADAPEVREQNVNGIEGHDLGKWLAEALRRAGCRVEAPWPEDHGWDLGLEHGGGRYLVSCSLDGADASREGHVVVSRPRSIMDRLKGRNVMTADDPVVAAVKGALATHPDVRALELHTA